MSTLANDDQLHAAICHRLGAAARLLGWICFMAFAGSLLTGVLPLYAWLALGPTPSGLALLLVLGMELAAAGLLFWFARRLHQPSAALLVANAGLLSFVYVGLAAWVAYQTLTGLPRFYDSAVSTKAAAFPLWTLIVILALTALTIFTLLIRKWLRGLHGTYFLLRTTSG